MVLNVLKMTLALWFIAICLDVCQARGAWAPTKEGEMLTAIFWFVKSTAYIVASILTICVIVTW